MSERSEIRNAAFEACPDSDVLAAAAAERDMPMAGLNSICVKLPVETYGCMEGDKVKEALAAAGVSYK